MDHSDRGSGYVLHIDAGERLGDNLTVEWTM